MECTTPSMLWSKAALCRTREGSERSYQVCPDKTGWLLWEQFIKKVHIRNKQDHRDNRAWQKKNARYLCICKIDTGFDTDFTTWRVKEWCDVKRFHVRVKGVRWATIEEGDANAHEEGDDDEAETSAEGVNESEPVNPTL